MSPRRAPDRPGESMIWLVDGRSGAGKTTWARRMGAVLGWPVAHLEDAYPGWGGLAAGSATVAADMLDPARPGFRRWDWCARDFAGDWAEWVDLDPARPLIIEGCGAVTAANIAAARRFGAVWPIWVELDAATRHARAMARDEHFAGHWAMWAAQEDAHIAAHDPVGRAGWIVRPG